MIYVIKSTGKGPHSFADRYRFLTFTTLEKANNYIEAYTQKCSEGHKYWTRFDIVKDRDIVEPCAE